MNELKIPRCEGKQVDLHLFDVCFRESGFHDTAFRMAEHSLQQESRGLKSPAFSLLPSAWNSRLLGLSALPPPSQADVFFNMEGFPLIDDGRGYLFGVCFRENGVLRFRDWWSHSISEEKIAFEGFVRWVHDTWKQNRDLHVYHYSSYEVTALQRLSGRHGVCEGVLNELLTNETFVDLYRTVRQSVAAVR